MRLSIIEVDTRQFNGIAGYIMITSGFTLTGLAGDGSTLPVLEMLSAAAHYLQQYLSNSRRLKADKIKIPAALQALKLTLT